MQTAMEKKSQRDNLLSLDEGGESNLEKPPAKMSKNTGMKKMVASVREQHQIELFPYLEEKQNPFNLYPPVAGEQQLRILYSLLKKQTGN